MGPGGRVNGGSNGAGASEANAKDRRLAAGVMQPEIGDPPEGGWGWMVAVGMAVMFISTTGQYGSFGLLFDGFLTRLGQKTTGATLIMNTLTASLNFTGLVTNHMLNKMSYRKVALLGGFLFTAGILLTTFAKSMAHVLVTYSVLAGVGVGLIAPSSFLAFNSYFLRKRGLAMGICQAGIGLGFMAGPPIIQYLIAEYAFSGTMLILSGVALHSLLGAALYQPIKWHIRKSRSKRNGRAHSDGGEKSSGDGGVGGRAEDQLHGAHEEAEEDNARISTICGKDGSNGEASVALLRSNGDAGTLPYRASKKEKSFGDHTADEEEEERGWTSNGQAEHLEELLPPQPPPPQSILSPQVCPEGLTEEQRAMTDASKNKCLPYQRQSSSLVNFGTIVLIFDNALTDQVGKDGELEVKEKPWTPQVEERVKEMVFEADVKLKKKKKPKGTTMGDKLRSAWERLVGKGSEPEDSAAVGSSRSLGAKTLFRCVVDFLDLRLLQDPSYVNLVLGISVSNLSDTNFFLVLQFYLQKSLGFSNESVALCLSVAAGADVASRLLLPLLGEHLHLRKRTAYLLGCLTSAIARSIFVLVEDFASVVAFCALVGFLKGTIVVNMPLTIAEHCRLEQFAAAFGLYMVINGLITITLGPLIGVVRDWSDSYEVCIHVLSGVLLLCAIPWLIEMAIVRWKQRRQKRDLPIL